MKKQLFIALITSVVLMVSLDGFCQSNKKSSYKIFKSRSAGNETEQLLDEATSVKEKDVSAALEKVQEALGISIAGNDLLNQARCYLLLGEINESISEWGLARENYSKVVALLKSDSPKSGMPAEYQKGISGLGRSEMKLGSYTDALANFQAGLEIANTVSAKNELRLLISDVYFLMANYDESAKILSEIQYGKMIDASLDTRIKNQKARIDARTKDDFKAEDIYDNSIKQTVGQSSIDPDEKKSLQATKEEVVDVLQKQGRYADESKLIENSIQFNTQINDYEEVTKDKVALSFSLMNQGQSNQALRIAEDAAHLSDTLDNPKSRTLAYRSLANLYVQFGRKDDAITAYQKYSAAATELETALENKNLQKEQILKKQKDIEELTKDVTVGQRDEAFQNAVVVRQKLVIYGLLLVILIIGVTSYFIYKNAQASKRANQLLALKSLRSQMNPHFIFNALNSVNHFIAQQDERTANRFLSEFSRLMRLVMENSQEEFISLSKELEILTLYLKLEHYRFREKFEYELNVDENINAETVQVPPMLIQPYIENAVWHGLRYRETPGKLIVNFKMENAVLTVEIIDDGIGRKKSIELKTDNQKKHSSTGLRNIDERLTILNKIYKYNYAVSITDSVEQTGTHVRLLMPIHKHAIEL